MDSCNLSISHILEQWENDLRAQMSDEEWYIALTGIHSTSICSWHALIQCYTDYTSQKLNLQEYFQT